MRIPENNRQTRMGQSNRRQGHSITGTIAYRPLLQNNFRVHVSMQGVAVLRAISISRTYLILGSSNHTEVGFHSNSKPQISSVYSAKSSCRVRISDRIINSMAYGTLRFNDAFTRAPLSRINPVTCNDTYFFKIHSNIVPPSMPRPP